MTVTGFTFNLRASVSVISKATTPGDTDTGGFDVSQLL